MLANYNSKQLWFKHILFRRKGLSMAYNKTTLIIRLSILVDN